MNVTHHPILIQPICFSVPEDLSSLPWCQLIQTATSAADAAT